MSNIDYSHILKAVWKHFPAAHCVSFPNPLTHKWQYGIIDKDRIRNAELSDLCDSEEGAWRNALNTMEKK